MNESADPLTAPLATSPHDTARLCDQCAKLDFFSLVDFDCHELSLHGVNVQDLGPISDWDSTCRICAFFNSIKYNTGEDANERCNWHIRAISNRFFFGTFESKRGHDSIREYEDRGVLLGVFNELFPRNGSCGTSSPQWNRLPCKLFVPIEHGCSEMDALFPLRYVDPQKVAYQHIKNWIKEDHHGLRNICRYTEMCTTQGLKLIDCDSCEVVHAKGMKYVALSYVWGRRTSSLSQPLNEAPQVVQDAIVVTKELNYRYLWVDQYCIDQNDADEKHDQIAQMDKIYSQADLTIIAAAGLDADYGLPGVSVRARPSLDVELDEFTLRCTGTYPHLLVEQSKWNSRGWTFQEALLSTRHLFFTEEQVFFECPCFSGCESIDVNPGRPLANIFVLHANDVCEDHFTQNITSYLQSSWFREVRPGGHRVWEFDKIVAKYCRRELSHQEDTLNAILGVLNDFANGPDPLLHIYGIPFAYNTRDHGHMGPSLLTTLNWEDGEAHRFNSQNIEPHFAAALAWKDMEGRQLLPHLPSWTWAAWSINSDNPGPRQPVIWDEKGTWHRRHGYPHASFELLYERETKRRPIWDWGYFARQKVNVAANLPSLFIQSYVITVPVTFEGGSDAGTRVNGVASERCAISYRADNSSLNRPISVDDWAARELSLSTGKVKEVDALVLSGYKTYPKDALGWFATEHLIPGFYKDRKWDGQELDIMLIGYVDECTVRRISVFRISVPRVSLFNLGLQQRRVDFKLV